MILLLFLFGLALGAESPSDDNEVKLQLDHHKVRLQRGNCPMFWYRFSDRCYKYVSTRMTWADAQLHCVSEGATLVSIHSLNEHNFVKSLIHNFDPVQGQTWIGLSDLHKEGRWMWSDGSSVRFSVWSRGEPNNWKGIEHCVDINYGNDKKWNDNQCSEIFPFVCATHIDCK